jgi:translation initiation factor 3 subunit D
MTESKMNKLAKLEIHFNPDGWGPINGEKILKFGNVPYLHFDKKDKISRPADFVSQNVGSSQQAYSRSAAYIRRRVAEDGMGGDYFARHEANEEKSFQLVDNTSKGQQRHKHTGAKRQTQNKQQNRQGGASAGNKGGNTGNRGDFPSNFSAAKNKMDGFRNKFGSSGYRGGRRNDRKVDRVSSVAVGGDWEIVEEFDLAQLLKLVANPPAAEDLLWCGFVDQYDDNYDKLTTRTSRGLRRCENKLFYDVTSSDDPILEKLAVDGLGDVIATDSIIAHLMAAPRSIYSWDILVQKVNGIIFLDKRENSAIDYLTVSETALEAPNNESDEINHPDKLALEATLINQNFSQQIVLNDSSEENRKSVSCPLLFLASVFYSYLCPCLILIPVSSVVSFPFSLSAV